MYDIAMPMEAGGRELPTIYGLRQEDLPEIIKLEVGDKRYLVVKVEVVAKRSGKGMGLRGKEEQNKVEADFQIHSIKTLGVEPVDAKSLEQKEFQDMVNRVKSGEM